MTDSEAATDHRRSQRDRKPAKTFLVGGTSKRKREDTDTEGDYLDASDAEDLQVPDHDQDEEDYGAPKTKPGTSPAKGKGKGVSKAKGLPSPKKARAAKGSVPKPAKSTKSAPRKSKKAATADGPFDATKVAEETKITGDNPLFNAIMNPAAVLQETAEDFLEALTQSPGPAQAEFINLILRACGCNNSVDADEALDYDGVVDSLDTFTEGLKNDDSPVYPLTSKLPAFKKFRKSLADFIHRLIKSSADLGPLYTSDLMSTLQTWVIAMSSSQIRSFRHTATVIALEVETALCEVAAAVEKEAEVLGRQKEGERKRKATNKGRGVREKELDGKAADVRNRRSKLAEFIKEFVDGVFVHRYRDLDPNIRADCVRAIGLWFQKYPGHFLDASYLRYVGWVLSDSATPVRLEAVKALSGVYAQADYIGSLNHFTERFKPRLIEMAAGDTELTVRVAVIQVLEAIEGHSLLEDDEREKLCLLVFDEEAKIRKAVSGFVRGVWEEHVDELLAGRKASQKDKTMAGAKALAVLLVKWGNSLDKVVGGDAEEDDSVEGTDEGVGPSRASGSIETTAWAGFRSRKGRIAFAVEALWDDVEPARDWEGLLDVLLLDHSTVRDGGPEGSSRPRSKGKANLDNDIVDEAWRLEEDEETVLIEVLVAAIHRAKLVAVSGKKGDEGVANDITRALIKALPLLFIKHQTDQRRITNVLILPTLMNLDLYLEMRLIPAYASLWDDVSKQFLSHSSSTVHTHAVAAIRQFMEATSLSNTNSTKILELEDELSTSLRDIIAGREEIEVASFTEDEVLAMSALCTRLTVLAGTRDMTTWIEENEGGKQSSAWDILSAIVERGRLGYKEEEMMIDQAIRLLTLHIIWKARFLTTVVDPLPEADSFSETLREQRESLLEKLIEYAVGTQSNTADGVKRAAFHNLMTLHILFCAPQAVGADGGPLPIALLSLTLDDEVQFRCAGFIQAEIERYAEDVHDGTTAEVNGSDDDSSADELPKETNVRLTNGKTGKGQLPGKNGVTVDSTSRVKLEREYEFIEIISTFLRAIRAGAIHPSHGAILLAHYGRLGPTFDLCCKVVVDVLREEGLFNDNGDLVVTAIVQSLQESFILVLDRIVHDATHSIALSKLLVSCTLLRGAQLSIIRRLDSQFIVRIHTLLLTWISKRLAMYEKNKNKKSLKTAVMFFKVLLPLLTVDGSDAQTIKAHMEQVLTEAKVDTSSSSKLWEPHRAYEKRLLSKDKGTKSKERKSRRKGDKTVAETTTDDEEGNRSENPPDEPMTVPPPRPKPRPLRRVQAEEDDSLPVTRMDEAGDEAANEVLAERDFSTPKARPRPKATYRVKSPTKSPSKSPTKNTGLSDADVNGFDTPSKSRKRGRVEDDEDLEENPIMIHGLEDVGGDTATLSREPTPASDIQIRRKRVRH